LRKKSQFSNEKMLKIALSNLNCSLVEVNFGRLFKGLKNNRFFLKIAILGWLNLFLSPLTLINNNNGPIRSPWLARWAEYA
jgi:hypothetical protein